MARAFHGELCGWDFEQNVPDHLLPIGGSRLHWVMTSDEQPIEALAIEKINQAIEHEGLLNFAQLAIFTAAVKELGFSARYMVGLFNEDGLEVLRNERSPKYAMAFNDRRHSVEIAQLIDREKYQFSR